MEPHLSPLPSKPPLPLIVVSETANDLIADSEAAFCRLSATPSDDQQAVGDAYAALSQRRKELYEYIEQLEARLGLTRTVKLRFD